jgi:hypothetical protein
MKSKNLLLLITKIKNIHNFYVSRFILWIFSTLKKNSFIGILYHVFNLCWLDFQAFHISLNYWKVTFMIKMNPQMNNCQFRDHRRCHSYSTFDHNPLGGILTKLHALAHSTIIHSWMLTLNGPLGLNPLDIKVLNGIFSKLRYVYKNCLEVSILV